MTSSPFQTSQAPWLETVLAGILFMGLVHCGMHIWLNGYLPGPFFYEPWDTFADWFNTAFWARGEGAYDTWRALYPPLSFLFLRVLGIDRCYPDVRAFDHSVGLAARSCDWLGLLAIAVIFLLNVILSWKVMRRIDPVTAPMRTMCISMGAPMLNGLERGNLIIIAYPCLVLACTSLLASARARWFFAGLAINFKIYLVASVIPLLLKRRWRWVEGALLSAILIYLVSLALYGQGTPIEIYENISSFTSRDAGQVLDIWYTTTNQLLYSLLNSGTFPFAQIIGSAWVERLALLLPMLVYLTQGLLLLAALAIWYRPEAFSPHRVLALSIIGAIVTNEAGGYSQICFMLFVLMEPWRGFGRKWAIATCYILSFPFDVPIDFLPEVPRDLYFHNATAMITYPISFGTFVRPTLIMTIGWALALVTIRELRDELREARSLPAGPAPEPSAG